MPSDDRIASALAAVAAPREAFLSSVAVSAEEVRGILEREKSAARAPQEKLALELGPFAAGRIDPDRLVPFVSGNSRLDAESRARIEEAYDVLVSLRKEGDALFTVEVEPGGYLRGAILEGLARAGRAFGAARVVKSILGGKNLLPGGVENPLAAFPFAFWNRAERGCAPPLVVEVEGADLKVASLGEILEGALKIVLVVKAPAAPAPLVRLVTPGVMVIQTEDPKELAVAAGGEGPAVAALMPAGSASFSHLPGEGKRLNERLEVRFLPEAEPRKVLGTISSFQQAEELRQLASLRASVEAAGAAPGAAPAMDEAGQLAAWLIHQANLQGV